MRDHLYAIEVELSQASRWHAFVYYRYTGIINFSGLRSQAGTEATLQQSPLKDGPPHCSPKSMYQLAQKVTSNLHRCISMFNSNHSSIMTPYPNLLSRPSKLGYPRSTYWMRYSLNLPPGIEDFVEFVAIADAHSKA
jgi:hypothetical protein